MKRKLYIIIALIANIFTMHADYSVTEIKGDVKGVRGNQRIALAFGSKLKSADKLTIGKGGSISFKDAEKGVVYTSSAMGTHTVKVLVDKASEESNKSALSLKKYVSVLPKKKTLKDHNYKTSGVVTRMGILRNEEIGMEQREKGSREVAEAIKGWLNGEETTDAAAMLLPLYELNQVPSIGVEIREAENYMLPVVVVNRGENPVYINAIRIDERGKADFSPMGIRTGIYSLLPGEEVEMECPEWMTATEYVVISKVPFDMYEVIRQLIK